MAPAASKSPATPLATSWPVCRPLLPPYRLQPLKFSGFAPADRVAARSPMPYTAEMPHRNNGQHPAPFCYCLFVCSLMCGLYAISCRYIFTTAAGSRSHEASKDTETNRQRHGTRGTIIYNRQYANDALPTTEDAPPSHKHPHWSFSRQTANHTAKTAHSRAQMRRSPFRSPRPPPALHLSFRKASAPSFCGA